MSEFKKERIEHYETLLREIWITSAKYLGMVSVNLLLERVVWEVSLEHKEIELLQYDQNGISCAKIAACLEENSDLPVEDMFMKFITRYVAILAKLLGHERAEEIKNKLKEEATGIPFSTREE
ncbi:MAG: hypothetical protein AB1538_06285 [Bacillota bacterium]